MKNLDEYSSLEELIETELSEGAVLSMACFRGYWNCDIKGTYILTESKDLKMAVWKAIEWYKQIQTGDLNKSK